MTMVFQSSYVLHICILDFLSQEIVYLFDYAALIINEVSNADDLVLFPFLDDARVYAVVLSL